MLEHEVKPYQKVWVETNEFLDTRFFEFLKSRRISGFYGEVQRRLNLYDPSVWVVKILDPELARHANGTGGYKHNGVMVSDMYKRRKRKTATEKLWETIGNNELQKFPLKKEVSK